MKNLSLDTETRRSSALTLDLNNIYLFIYYVHFSAQVNKDRKCAKCNSHLSNKNVLNSFPNEFLVRERSFILAGRSFQIVGPETLNDFGPNVIVSWFLECIAVLMWQIATVSGWALTRLQYSHSPGREVPIRSNTGTSEWRS